LQVKKLGDKYYNFTSVKVQEYTYPSSIKYCIEYLYFSRYCIKL